MNTNEQNSQNAAAGESDNQDLDRICCEFAGIQPDYSTIKPIDVTEFVADPTKSLRRPIYPPVSTDWSASGKLRERLLVMGVFYIVSCVGKSCDALVQLPDSGRFSAEAETEPMALALAVARLAEATK